ncbi:cold-shock protein [Thiopseudomonas alkaliphila]|uniref:cold-shock protein n=1 Tax=Thiopseudomonas alkaliphila TaxID=1697053 RepID=UPI00069E99CD|nr:cold shock domain-containing protein [Thiopseudomonas alkaliphila]AKX51939.1 cold-shock protein [Thiopseudomonas alkaliphila]AKX58284.1 cold-shock protein [Thiopseudomonas alkaliphila]
MIHGKVKWFNNTKGYGFIVVDGGQQDIFAHHSAINMEGYRSLKAGQKITFEQTPAPKGIHAINIRLISEK